MSAGLSTFLLMLLAALLLACCWFDWRSRIIPNGLNAAIALLAIPFWWAAGLALWPDIALQIGLAVAVFAIFALAFAIGAMGGGDVKLLGALALWLPWQALLAMLVIMSIAGGVLTLGFVVAGRIAGRTERPEIPYGLAIAFGGLWVLSERFLYQFG
ncbi:hypothetical protein GCM10023232_11190 [Sphingosinicella ginsenosidimutans]|uniref:Peptidase n=1 Tax=Allosphingosinicella ginsenosidimutans TaxID=1176539 RepID=A0A5C6TQD5_9SPHN|nr:prepilin peptidase [Sphingosinicella ginsenosidimutans]TXC62231.1 peptidase [Sphingosinicella ginsenosidimutans]